MLKIARQKGSNREHSSRRWVRSCSG